MADIFINLSESTDARELKERELIHRSQFKRTVNLINEGIAKAEVIKDGVADHIHEAITILGTRGSGKTTFLLSIREYFNKNEKIHILDNIDPTLIEEKGHIFLYIVSIIDDLVVNHLVKNDQDLAKRKEWRDSVYKLAHGLPSMDGVGGGLNESDWQDPEFIMQKGLRSVSAARELSSLFQEVIQKALKHIGREAFLITFDDIDIDFKKGWNILETIRKYLHTSRIITVLSGDLRLYILAIRKQYWNSFGKSILINEGDKLGKLRFFNDRITELESQYILKVIKPERRIHLTTLFEKIEADKSKPVVERDNFILLEGEQEIRIESFYKNILSSFGIRNKYQSETYTSFLLSMPIRSQIRFLSQFIYKFESSDVNVIDTFLSDLAEKNVDINVLSSNTQLLNVEVLKLLLSENKLKELYQLQPITTDHSLNSALLSLTLLLSDKIKKSPFLIFDYFIKVGYTRNLLSMLGYNTENQQKFSSLSPSIESLCEHSEIFQNKVLRDIAGSMTAYVKGSILPANNRAGIITLPGLADTSKKGSSEIENRIDRIFKNSTYSQRILGFIPLSISAYSTNNRTIPCYSVFTLLATIGELIRKSELQDVSYGLEELSEVRTYNMPEFKKGVSEKTESAPFLSETGDHLDPDGTELFSRVQDWIEYYKQLNIKVSPHLLGKISTRFFYALNSIENIEKETNLGKMMHRRIVALFNAILIEDVRENVQNAAGLNINNTNLNDDILIRNLKLGLHYTSDLGFSRWLISCPLLLCYLNPNSYLTVEIFEFMSVPYGNAHRFQNMSIYSLLLGVPTKGNKLERQSQKGSISNYENIIATLIERQVPFDLFDDSDDQGSVRGKNTYIRTNLSDLFGENVSPSAIRSFRNYIKRTNKQW